MRLRLNIVIQKSHWIRIQQLIQKQQPAPRQYRGANKLNYVFLEINRFIIF